MKAKIFLATHLDTVKPVDPLFETVRVGSVLLSSPKTTATDSDFEDNISIKNPHYSELTLMYDIWKNRSKDYDIVGLAHYRRTFYHKNICTDKYEYGKKSRPLLEYEHHVFNDVFSSEHYKLHFKAIESGDVDVVTLQPFEKSTNYALFTFADLGWIPARTVIAFYDYIRKTQPSRLADFIEYWTLNQKEHYCNNMFYAETEIFNDYAEWLLTTLFGFEKHLEQLETSTGLTYITPRMFGYFSEYMMRPYFEYKNYNVEFATSVCFDNLKTDDRI